jgi:hypothetical protein
MSVACVPGAVAASQYVPPAGGGGSSADRWRVLVASTSDSASPQFCEISEVEFRTTPGGSNAATGGTASASGNLDTRVPANCFDGSGTTVWLSTSFTPNTPAWIAYAFASAVTIVEVAIKPTNSGNINRFPHLFAVQYSTDSGTTWHTQWTVAGATASTTATQTFTDPSYGASPPAATPDGDHAYWRLNITDTSGHDYCEVNDVEFRRVPGGVTIAVGGTATADSEIASSVAPQYAFDDRDATEWLSLGTLPHWIAYHFPDPVSVAQVAIRSPNSNLSRFPKDFQVQYSDTGSSWTTAWSVTGATAASANTTYTFTDPDYVP